MSEIIIKDGTGKAFNVKVNEFFELKTRASSVQIFDDAVERGKGYIGISGAITLTSANASGIFYLKNNGLNSIKIEKTIVQSGVSTGGTGGTLTGTTYFAATTGTLISGALTAPVANLNLTSSNQFDGIAYLGAEGTTITDGAPAFEIFKENDRVELKSHLIVPQGGSIAITITPPTGNTSMLINFQTFFYEIEG